MFMIWFRKVGLILLGVVGSVCFGDWANADVDGDGRDEILVTWTGDSGERYRVYDDQQESFDILLAGGDGWGDDRPATAAAWGDLDGDGLDELAIGRDSDSNDQIFIYDD